MAISDSLILAKKSSDTRISPDDPQEISIRIISRFLAVLGRLAFVGWHPCIGEHFSVSLFANVAVIPSP